jgi:preprotein translocase subunit SecE
VAKRRSRAGAADEFDDALDDVALDDDALDDAVPETAGDDDGKKPRRGSTALAERPSRRRFGFGRLGRFVREVVAELRKVIWPTRKELVTYSVVVVFFVAVFMAIIAGFDTGFAYAVNWVFGE